MDFRKIMEQLNNIEAGVNEEKNAHQPSNDVKQELQGYRKILSEGEYKLEVDGDYGLFKLLSETDAKETEVMEHDDEDSKLDRDYDDVEDAMSRFLASDSLAKAYLADLKDPTLDPEDYEVMRSDLISDLVGQAVVQNKLGLDDEVLTDMATKMIDDALKMDSTEQ